MKSKKRYIVIFITIAIFVFLLSKVEPAKAWDVISKANLWYLIAAAFLSLLFPVLSALRWDLIVRQLGKRLGFWTSFKIIMAAWPLGTITPAKSGDLIKIVYLKKHLAYSKTTGVIIAERMLDLFVLSFTGFTAGCWFGMRTSIIVCGPVFLGLLLFFALLISPWIRLIPNRFQDLATDLLQATKSIYPKPLVFLLLFLITLCNWMLTFLQTWLCFYAFGAVVPFEYILAALPIAIFVGLAPITPSGMGTRDLAMIELFKSFASYEICFAIGILYSIFAYWLLSILGLPFMNRAMMGQLDKIPLFEKPKSTFKS